MRSHVVRSLMLGEPAPVRVPVRVPVWVLVWVLVWAPLWAPLWAESASARDLHVERPGDGRGSAILDGELQELSFRIQPHAVHWTEAGAWSPPDGAWGLGRWQIFDEGSDLELHAEFVTPSGRVAALGICPGCLRKTGGRWTDLVIENALKDLLNRTLFDPELGFMGFVQASRCSTVKVVDVYLFSSARLRARHGDPGLCEVGPRFWRKTHLELEVPELRDDALEFSGSGGSLVDRLGSCTATDLELETTVGSTREIEFLDHDLCQRTSLGERSLRFMLSPEEPTPLTFEDLDRTDRVTGGN